MPNQRAPGQTMVGCYVDGKFAAEIDRARGGKNRSDFIREILFEYLVGKGHELPAALKYAPDRTGKGGRSRKLTAVPGLGKKQAAARKRA